MRSFLISLVVFLLGAACGAGVLWLKAQPEAAASQREAELLRAREQLHEEENDRLRSIVAGQERTQALEKNKAQREEIEKQVTEIRGLPFKRPVDYDLLSRQGIKDIVAGKLEQTFSKEDFVNMSAALARLGLLPEGYPLRQKYIDLLGEQIAAFYDQHQHKLFMFEDATLDNAQNRVVLAHELTHALQDQHFNLLRLPLEIKSDDDRAEASSALVEGEATIVMNEFMMKNMSLQALKDNLKSSFGQNMNQLAQAPRYLREELVFPYLRGQEFCAALMEQGGYGAISKAFANPPDSTAQILHPEKYLAQPREEPLAIHWPETTFRGEKAAADNVLGELGIRILLEESGDASTAERTAAGWRGDRYLSFQGGEALVWKTLWASEQAAEAFFHAESAALEKRYQPVKPEAGDRQLTADQPRALRLLRLPGNAVILIDAAAAEAAKELQDRFGQ